MITITTAAIESPLAQTIDWALARISSSSITGSPVRPIVTVGWRAATPRISRRSSSVASDAPAKPPLDVASRRRTNPIRPSLARSWSLERSRRVESEAGIPGQGEMKSSWPVAAIRAAGSSPATRLSA